MMLSVVGLTTVIHIAPSSAVIISDGDLYNADWTSQVIQYSGPAVSFQVNQSAIGGHPGTYRWLAHTFGGYGRLETGHLYQAWQYDPAIEGSLAGVSLAFDLKLLIGGTSGAVGYGLLLYQDAHFFWPGEYGVWAEPADNVWRHFELPYYEEGDFVDILTGAQPDFSVDGSPIMFGYWGSNGTDGAAQTTTESGLDNWTLTVNSGGFPQEDGGGQENQGGEVPEPSTLLLLLPLFGAGAVRMLSNKRNQR